jgi:hypothetical protein
MQKQETTMAHTGTGTKRDPTLCQIETAQEGGRMRVPGSLYIPSRIFSNLRKHGLVYTLRATFGPRIAAVRKKLQHAQTAVVPQVFEDEVLDLEPGEIVEVKSLPEILKTLDDKGKYRGLVFTPEMRRHCDKRYRVYKRLELMFDEYHKSQRRVKNTVLLQGVVCEGAGIGCDRSCFLYWREIWLRRPEQASAPRKADEPSRMSG